jgi:anhydro-N-acetylmuramic acid kinase
VVETDGVDILSLGETRYRAYSDEERAVLRAALGTWPGDDRAEAAARVVERPMRTLCEGWTRSTRWAFTARRWPMIRRTGAPIRRATARDLAQETGRMVIWDFRSTDLEMGGQGAPLAPFYHWACARIAGGAGRWRS